MKQMKFFGGFFSGWTIPFLLIPLFSIGCTPLPDHGFSSLDPVFKGNIKVFFAQEHLAVPGPVCKRAWVQNKTVFNEEYPVCRSKKRGQLFNLACLRGCERATGVTT